MEFSKKQNYPTYLKPGIYPDVQDDKKIGLDNDELEQFSLGNWNSIVKDNRIFPLRLLDVPSLKGRPVEISFDEITFQRGLNHIAYSRDVNGQIIPDSITDVESFPTVIPLLGGGETFDPDDIPRRITSITGPGLADAPIISQIGILRHFAIYGNYYTGENVFDPLNNIPDGWPDDRTFYKNINTIGFLKPRDVNEENARLVIELDSGDSMGLTYEFPIPQGVFGDQFDFTHELFFPKNLKIKNPTENSFIFIETIIAPPEISNSGFFEIDLTPITNEMAQGNDLRRDYLVGLGFPSFEYNDFFGDEEIVNSLKPKSVSFLVDTSTENENEFLYYDIDEDETKYLETSYPVKVNLRMSIFGESFTNSTLQPYSPTLNNLYYLDESEDIAPLINDLNFNLSNSYFTYQVIQWGDENNLLSDEQIEQTYFFNLYDLPEYPSDDNYFLKKWYASQIRESIPLEQTDSHVYNQPGVKSIKIVIYRYDDSRSLLLQTYLVTKNIVINDGLLQAQDFSVFGGINFTFLPIKENQAVFLGFSEASDYNRSISKLVKDDNFTQNDYLNKAAAKNYLKQFNDGKLGDEPGQIDLGLTRIFNEPRDIYDFITNDKQQIINNDFTIETLPINSPATDIFIEDDRCIVDLNPEDLETFNIRNRSGYKEQVILTGDYKISQNSIGDLNREGVVKTPNLETDKNRQAF